jgi:hypothetical protein
MENLLPAFKTFSLDDESLGSTLSSKDQRKSFASSSKWQLKELDSLPSYLDDPKRPLPPEEVPSYQKNLRPPNNRYAEPINPLESELSALHRGVAVEAKMADLPKPKKKYPTKRYNNKASSNDLSIILDSRLPNCVDLSISTTTNVDSISVTSNTIVKKNLISSAPQDREYNKYSDVYVLLATPKLISINMTNRQEIRDFDFYDGPIGLEVEIQYGKITVTKVIEDSQAASYGTVLMGAEIIAVNDQRVITLEEFQSVVLMARSMGMLITIKAASYKGDKL